MQKNISVAVEGEKIKPLRVVTDRVIHRLRNQELPWQTRKANLAPTNISGKLIANINFLMLVGLDGDHRWGSFFDFNSMNISIPKGTEAVQEGIFWKSVKKSDGSGTYMKPKLSKLFNADQMGGQLPAFEKLDIYSQSMQIAALIQNAGINLGNPKDRKPGTPEFWDGTIYFNPLESGEEDVSSAIYGLVKWAMTKSGKNHYESSGEIERFMLVTAIATSMVSSEFGVAVSSGLCEDMKMIEKRVLEFSEKNGDFILRCSREAWDIRQLIAQYAPTFDEAFDDDEIHRNNSVLSDDKSSTPPRI